MPILLTCLLITVLITVTNCVEVEGFDWPVNINTAYSYNIRGRPCHDLGQKSLFIGSEMVSDQFITNRMGC